MGGGGFSMEPKNPRLDRFVLGLTGVARPKVCFLATASGDSADYTERFYNAFRRLEAEPTHLSLFRGTTADHAGLLLSQNVIYVGGGNTRNLLALWREWGLDRLMKDAYDRGIVLAGVSAGAICWFEEGITDSVPSALSPLKCLGFLEGSCCPHYDGEPDRRPSFHRLLAAGQIGPGYAIDDSAALHFADGRLKEGIASLAGKKAYRMSYEGGEIREVPFELRILN